MNDEDDVVDMEGELINALEEIDRLRLKKRKQKQLLMQYEKNVKAPSANCILLKIELEEAKKISDVLKEQLSQKKMRCEALEEEVVKFMKELEKFQSLYHQNLSSIKASKELNNISSKQRSPFINTGLGYEEGTSSSQSENKETTKVINFKNNNQSEYTKSTNFIQAEANKNISEDKLMSGKDDIATGTDNHVLHSRKHEEEIKNRMTRQFIPRRQ